MSLLALPRGEVEAVLEAAGAELLQVDEQPDPEYGITSSVYFARRLSSRRDG
jgi:hypothetical protein